MQIVVSLSVSPRRNMEADDDVDNDYRKYYATWCHACHDTTPSKHTHKMETLLTRTRIRGLHVHVLKGSLHLRPFHRAYFENMTSCRVFFYNQADVISEAIKEPCISEKKNLTNKSSVNALKMWVKEVKKKTEFIILSTVHLLQD